MVYPEERVVVARLREVEDEADAKEKKNFRLLMGEALFNERPGEKAGK